MALLKLGKFVQSTHLRGCDNLAKLRRLYLEYNKKYQIFIIEIKTLGTPVQDIQTG